MRYNRQELLGIDQEKLLGSKVAVVGVGALGTVASELLVRSGVGEILLIDRDVVEESNLQRQMLFSEKDVGLSKALVAKEKLREINSSIEIESCAIHLDASNVDVLDQYDLVLDCSDNLEVRFLINEYCKKNSKTWIYSAAIKTHGYVMVVNPKGPCLNCFLKTASLDTCDTVGVLNTITTTIAAKQVTLALKVLVGEKVEAKLYYYDIWNDKSRELVVKKKESCSVCNGEYSYLDKKERSTIQFCSGNKYQVFGPKPNFEELEKKLKPLGEVHVSETLRFKEILLFKDGRALITAKSKEEAESLYAKYIGK